MKPCFAEVFAGVFALSAFSLLGCSSDSSQPGAASGGSTGGEVAATGGASAGGATTSPTSSGGALPSGGTPASGGLSQASSVSQGGLATGGAATSAAGQPATGGRITGGSTSDGAAGGEGATGGTGAGGSKTGGSVAGGGVTGGTIGGVSTGGAAPGGKTSTGGSPGGAGGRGSGGAVIAGGSSGASSGTYPVSAGTPTVYLAGDSTVSTYAPSTNNQQGWGQRLQEFFDPNGVIVVNKAIGGESSKSFADQGHLAEIVGLLKPGDYLFAQWGINDRSVAGPDRATDPATTFRTYLKQYIDGARSKNAIPVLITPTPRHQYSGGVFGNGFPEYCTAIKAVGAETNTLVIDLQSKGLAYYTSIGEAKVTSTIILNGTDPLHFNAEGAYQMARLVAQGVVEINVPISQYVIQSKLQAH